MPADGDRPPLRSRLRSLFDETMAAGLVFEPGDRVIVVAED